MYQFYCFLLYLCGAVDARAGVLALPWSWTTATSGTRRTTQFTSAVTVDDTFVRNRRSCRHIRRQCIATSLKDGRAAALTRPFRHGSAASLGGTYCPKGYHVERVAAKGSGR